MSTIAPEDAGRLAAEWEELPAELVVERAVALFHPQLVCACSFQKEESVIVDLLASACSEPRVFTIDTGVLFQETLATWREFEQRFGIAVEVHDARSPDGDPWTAERCCGEHKVDALERALSGTDAWITGIRREQAATRSESPKIEWDAAREIWKLNPLADWSEREVWQRIAERELPHNPLHDRGYGSIGCEPCTAPGSGRAGRWAGTDRTECGLHVA